MLSTKYCEAVTAYTNNGILLVPIYRMIREQHWREQQCGNNRHETFSRNELLTLVRWSPSLATLYMLSSIVKVMCYCSPNSTLQTRPIFHGNMVKWLKPSSKHAGPRAPASGEGGPRPKFCFTWLEYFHRLYDSRLTNYNIIVGVVGYMGRFLLYFGMRNCCQHGLTDWVKGWQSHSHRTDLPLAIIAIQKEG